jgi:CHAT domain-containing protein
MTTNEKRYSPVHMLLVLMQYVPARFDSDLEALRLSQPEDINQLVDDLKTQADLGWGYDPQISLELANRIIMVGHTRGDDKHLALGLMARGDALRMMGNRREAWLNLRQAGKLYIKADCKVGWGRTRIGLVPLASNLNRLTVVEVERRIARRIFLEHDEVERAIRLDLNSVVPYLERGRFQEALELAFETLVLARTASEFRDYHEIRLYNNIGYIYTEMGELHLALEFYQKALERAIELGETTIRLQASSNIAYIAWIQGRYRDATQGLLDVLRLAGDSFQLEQVETKRLLIQCYLSLNRFVDARLLASQITHDADDSEQGVVRGLSRGYALIDLAVAEAHLGHLDAAYLSLEQAEAIFLHGDSKSGLYDAYLRRAQIALRLRHMEDARLHAEEAAAYFLQNGEQVHYAAAQLLIAQVAAQSGDAEESLYLVEQIQQVARSMNIAWLDYSGQLIRAQIAEAQQKTEDALKYYDQAAGTVEAMQRGLTIALRPEFLQSREDAFHGLVRLHLQRGDAARAFESLERNKSQTMLGQIANRAELRWSIKDEHSRSLLDALTRLRADHNAYYQLAYGQLARDGQPIHAGIREQSRQRLEDVEQQMRDITQKLHLLTDPSRLSHIEALSLADIQARIEPDDVLIAFYAEPYHLWGLVIEQGAITAYRLPMSPASMWKHLEEVRQYVKIALEMARSLGTSDKRINPLTTHTQTKLGALYEGLLGPLTGHLRGRRRLIMVPSGALHYLPFHLLFNAQGYLIQQHEVVVLPAAGLLTLPRVSAPSGVLAVADTYGGKLPGTVQEAAYVAALLDGSVCSQAGVASLDCLSAPPRQVLHIAAHGEYRVDQPELSYIELGGQQVFTDDLLQHDLGYELVTLSACETGRAAVAPGDELVGIGRGFLYAGAGALITSLWKIDDGLTVRFMESLYGQLKQGASKASALRGAQQQLLMETPQLHPAFWGAFQLVGNADPLSTITQ